MTSDFKRTSVESWLGQDIPRGVSTDVTLPISESYSSISLQIPIRIIRAEEDGPTGFVVAALHGDELNGTGAIRSLICDESLSLRRGSLILAPIVNLLGFNNHSRYLPDRRDLNRSFPGSSGGSLGSRIANLIFAEIVTRCDFGIDLHTASVRRTNYPNIRADMNYRATRNMAQAFGTEIIVNSRGIEGSLRREACSSGCPTIVLEGGEVWKVEPAIVETALRGIKNVLRSFEMIEGEIATPEKQVVIERAKWVRADKGGFLQFHVHPGQAVERDQPLATNTDLMGKEQNVLRAPFNGIIIGMTTLPAIGPGSPVCHIGELPKDTHPEEISESRSEMHGLEERLVEELSSNVMVVERESRED
jgi:uncharacterized protein